MTAATLDTFAPATAMLRALFTTHPADGHFHPQVPLARAPAAAGDGARNEHAPHPPHCPCQHAFTLMIACTGEASA